VIEKIGGFLLSRTEWLSQAKRKVEQLRLPSLR